MEENSVGVQGHFAVLMVCQYFILALASWEGAELMAHFSWLHRGSASRSI